MPGGQRSRPSEQGRATRRGVAYWVSLLIGCLAVVLIGGLVYFHFVPQQFPRMMPTPTYSKGPGGLYDPGVTLIPNPPVTHAP